MADQTEVRDVCGNKRGGTHPCALRPGHLDDHADGEGHAWHNHGPAQRYEVVWMSGHVETVLAHQVSYPHAGMFLFAGGMHNGGEVAGPPRVHVHAEIDGQWLLTLAAREEDIRSMRLITDGEVIPNA